MVFGAHNSALKRPFPKRAKAVVEQLSQWLGVLSLTKTVWWGVYLRAYVAMVSREDRSQSQTVSESFVYRRRKLSLRRERRKTFGVTLTVDLNVSGVDDDADIEQKISLGAPRVFTKRYRIERRLTSEAESGKIMTLKFAGWSMFGCFSREDEKHEVLALHYEIDADPFICKMIPLRCGPHWVPSLWLYKNDGRGLPLSTYENMDEYMQIVIRPCRALVSCCASDMKAVLGGEPKRDGSGSRGKIPESASECSAVLATCDLGFFIIENSDLIAELDIVFRVKQSVRNLTAARDRNETNGKPGHGLLFALDATLLASHPDGVLRQASGGHLVARRGGTLAALFTSLRGALGPDMGGDKALLEGGVHAHNGAVGCRRRQ
ncbi:hypothetical protein FGB62_267g013 [Gracilaria domingensis]|nr:hypothetical protein FGB62_267g013 [Gracilaria domingensis]